MIVTQKGTSKSVKTYAFYDNGSSGYFLTENLKGRLEATSTKTQLQLGTMHGQSVVDSAVVEELIVSDPNGTNPIELPRAYTTNEIPVQHEQITTRDIVGRIDHLKEIAGEIPLYNQELDTGLLIRNNCPIALVPLKVVPNEGDGPFAVRLHHGWTVSGPVHIVTTPITKKKCCKQDYSQRNRKRKGNQYPRVATAVVRAALQRYGLKELSGRSKLLSRR